MLHYNGSERARARHRKREGGEATNNSYWLAGKSSTWLPVRWYCCQQGGKKKEKKTKDIYLLRLPGNSFSAHNVAWQRVFTVMLPQGCTIPTLFVYTLCVPLFGCLHYLCYIYTVFYEWVCVHIGRRRRGNIKLIQISGRLAPGFFFFTHVHAHTHTHTNRCYVLTCPGWFTPGDWSSFIDREKL